MVDDTAHVTREREYDSVVTVNHQHAKDAFLLDAYFTPRCRHYVLFTFGMARDLKASNSIQFWEYDKGNLLRHKVLARNQRESFFPRYAQLIFWFTMFALTSVPRRSWIVAPHPPVFLFGRILRALKMHRLVLILQDIFDYDSTRLSGVLFNRYVRHCARSIRNVLYLSPSIQERHAVKKRRPHDAGVRKRWSFGIKRRFDETELMNKASRVQNAATTVLGYIGVVRSCVGLETLMEYARHDESIRVDIVGEGVYTEEFIKKCKDAGLDSRITCHGFLATEDLHVLASDWICGTMLYDTEGDLYSRHGEPGKAKLYLALGLPVLMTQVSYIADEICQRKAGMVLSNCEPASVAGAVDEMKREYAKYIDGVIAMAKEYDYQSKYDDDFAFMQRIPRGSSSE